MTAPTSPASGALPALPEPAWFARTIKATEDGFTADQMRAYALAALASREAAGPAGPVMAQGNTVYQLNDLGWNRWTLQVQPGRDDNDSRVSDAECVAVAQRIVAALNAPAAALASPQVAPAPVPDPLQGAADWIKAGLIPCTASDIAGRLLIGYNRALRLFSGAAPAPVAPALKPAFVYNGEEGLDCERLFAEFGHGIQFYTLAEPAQVAPTPAQPSEAQLLALVLDNPGQPLLPQQREAALNRGRERYAAFLAASSALPSEPEGEAK